MNIFSDDSKENFVKLFIENVQYGKIKINVEGLENPLYSKHETLKNRIMYLANADIDDSDDYMNSIKTIYNSILELKLEGRIDGEFNDVTTEEIIHKLKLQNNRLKKDNQRLYNENLLLANELRDRQNILESYEQLFTKKDDKDESH